MAKNIMFIWFNLNFIVIWLVRWKHIRYCLKEYVPKLLVLIG